MSQKTGRRAGVRDRVRRGDEVERRQDRPRRRARTPTASSARWSAAVPLAHRERVREPGGRGERAPRTRRRAGPCSTSPIDGLVHGRTSSSSTSTSDKGTIHRGELTTSRYRYLQWTEYVARCRWPLHDGQAFAPSALDEALALAGMWLDKGSDFALKSEVAKGIRWPTAGNGTGECLFAREMVSSGSRCRAPLDRRLARRAATSEATRTW